MNWWLVLTHLAFLIIGWAWRSCQFVSDQDCANPDHHVKPPTTRHPGDPKP